MDDEVALLPAHALALALRRREISSRELLAATLARIDRINPVLNALVTLDVQGAEESARLADEAAARSGGEASALGSLHGLPFSVKDAIEVRGLRSTGGSAALANHIPLADAPAVARLRGAGAIVLGKSNVPTWSSDIQTYNDLFGTTANPWDPTLTSGGSSGGAAAAVATGMSSFELGTDIGGSIRIPASFCGVYGHKPSYGLVPQRGYLDRVGGGRIDTDVNVFGPLARCVDDLELLLGVLGGPLPEGQGAWTVALPPPSRREFGPYRVGVWLDDPQCPVDSEVLEVLEGAVAGLEHEGCSVATQRPPVSLGEAAELHDRLVRSAVSIGLTEPVGDRVGGSHRSWLELTERRVALRARWGRWFEDQDVLLCPVMSVPAFQHDQLGDLAVRRVNVNGSPTPHSSLLSWNSLASGANLPATAVTVGHTRSRRPVAVQVLARYLGDLTALEVARRIERACGRLHSSPYSANTAVMSRLVFA